MIWNRRDTLKGLGVIGAGLAMPAIATRSAAAQQTMTVAVDTGYVEAFRTSIAEDFTKETGIILETKPLTTGSAAQFQAQVETNTYQYHMAFGVPEQSSAQLQEKGFLEPLELDSNVKDAIPESMRSDYFLAHSVLVHGLTYMEDSFDTAPTKLADIWDLQGFAGRRSLRMNVRDAIETALRADGVAPEEIYSVLANDDGWKRAYAKLDEIKPNIAVWWDDDPQIDHAFGTGEVDMATWFQHRVLNFAKTTGMPLAFNPNQAFYTKTGWGIPKGSPMTKEARQLINFATNPVRIANFTKVYPIPPVHPEVFAHLDDELGRTLPTHPDNFAKIHPVDFRFWANDNAAKAERFRTWLMG